MYMNTLIYESTLFLKKQKESRVAQSEERCAQCMVVVGSSPIVASVFFVLIFDSAKTQTVGVVQCIHVLQNDDM